MAGRSGWSNAAYVIAAPYAAIIRAIAVAASPSLRATASTLAGGGETMSSQNAIVFVHDRRDMQTFVRIHAADDATLHSFDDSHSQPPALTVHERLRRDRMRGPDSHETMRGQALLGSQASAIQSPTARRPGWDRSGERHVWSIGVRVRPHRVALWRQPTKRSIAVRVRPPRNWP